MVTFQSNSAPIMQNVAAVRPRSASGRGRSLLQQCHRAARSSLEYHPGVNISPVLDHTSKLKENKSTAIRHFAVKINNSRYIKLKDQKGPS